MDESLNLTLIEDDALQAWIEHCGRQLLAAQDLLNTGPAEQLPAFKAERSRWLRNQEAALRERARRPHLVRAMEEARGLV